MSAALFRGETTPASDYGKEPACRDTVAPSFPLFRRLDSHENRY